MVMKVLEKRLMPMQRMYFCPNCRSPIAYGVRFCGNCGVNLRWVVPQMPPQSSPMSYGSQYPNQPQRYVYNKPDGVPRKNCVSTTTPIRAEISKLVANLFDKQTKFNKVG